LGRGKKKSGNRPSRKGFPIHGDVPQPSAGNSPRGEKKNPTTNRLRKNSKPRENSFLSPRRKPRRCTSKKLTLSQRRELAGEGKRNLNHGERTALSPGGETITMGKGRGSGKRTVLVEGPNCEKKNRASGDGRRPNFDAGVNSKELNPGEDGTWEKKKKHPQLVAAAAQDPKSIKDGVCPTAESEPRAVRKKNRAAGRSGKRR